MIVYSDKILSLRVFAKQRCAMRAGRTIWNVAAHCDNGKRSGSRASAASNVKVELASNERLRSFLLNESPVTLALLQAWATPRIRGDAAFLVSPSAPFSHRPRATSTNNTEQH